MSGFLSGALGNLMQGAGSGAAGGLLSEAFNSVGGVQGVISKFEQSGMGDKAQSWVGQGGNMGLAAEEVEKVFPPQQIEGWAEKYGVPQGVASQVLAHLLPHAVDSQTPGGQVPDGSAQDAQVGPGSDGGGGFNFGGLVQKLMG